MTKPFSQCCLCRRPPSSPPSSSTAAAATFTSTSIAYSSSAGLLGLNSRAPTWTTPRREAFVSVSLEIITGSSLGAVGETVT